MQGDWHSVDEGHVYVICLTLTLFFFIVSLFEK